MELPRRWIVTLDIIAQLRALRRLSANRALTPGPLGLLSVQNVRAADTSPDEVKQIVYHAPQAHSRTRSEQSRLILVRAAPRANFQVLKVLRFARLVKLGNIIIPVRSDRPLVLVVGLAHINFKKVRRDVCHALRAHFQSRQVRRARRAWMVSLQLRDPRNVRIALRALIQFLLNLAQHCASFVLLVSFRMTRGKLLVKHVARANTRIAPGKQRVSSVNRVLRRVRPDRVSA